MKSLVLGAVRVPLKEGGGGADTFSISGAREAELPGEFAGVEEVGRIVLIEHFVGFRDLRIEPSCKPDHGPAQNAIFWRNAKFLRGQGDKLLSCGRIGCGGNVPGLIPG